MSSFVKFQRCKMKFSFLMIVFVINVVHSHSKESITTLPLEWQDLHDNLTNYAKEQFLKAHSKVQFEVSSAKYEASSLRVLINALNRTIFNINDTQTCSNAIRYMTAFMENEYIDKLPNETFQNIELPYAVLQTSFRDDPSGTIFRIFKKYGYHYNKITQRISVPLETQDSNASPDSEISNETLPLSLIPLWPRWVWFIETLSSIEIQQDPFLRYWKKLFTIYKEKYDCRVICFSKLIVKAESKANKHHPYGDRDQDFIEFLSKPPSEIQQCGVEFAKCITSFFHYYSKFSIPAFSTTPLYNSNEEFAIDRNLTINFSDEFRKFLPSNWKMTDISGSVY